MMVNRYDDSRLLLVLQMDHSRVAGYLAAHWGNDQFAELRPYNALVLAAQEHDTGWWEWEVAPTLSPEGQPLDYIGTYKHLGRFRLESMGRSVERVIERNPYAGLVEVMHEVGLLNKAYGLHAYMTDYGDDPVVQGYIREREARRAELTELLRGSEEYAEFATDERIWTSFKYMEVFDQFAQFICNRYPFNSTIRKNGPSNRLSDTPVPVRPGAEDTTITVEPQDEDRAIVRPYPFDVDPLAISFPARVVPNGPYASRDDFLRHFYKAERVQVTYTLHSA